MVLGDNLKKKKWWFEKLGSYLLLKISYADMPCISLLCADKYWDSSTTYTSKDFVKIFNSSFLTDSV